DLINVPEFNIYNGRFVYRATGGRQAAASGINIHLLPNKLLRIDSLVDVKAALPEFSLRQFNLTFGKLQAHLFNFSFSGKQAENHSDSLDLLLPNGTRITGSSVYWHALDWDLLQRSKQLVAQAVRIGQLTAHITHSNSSSAEKKDLPPINIGTVEIDKGDMLVESPKGDISFNLDHVSLQHLASDKKQFTWDQAKFVLENFHQQTATTQISIAKFQFDNQSESILSGLSIVSETENARTRIALPTARLLLPLHGTDMKSLTIGRLVLDNPQVDLVSLRQKKSPANSISIPADISLNELKWNNLKLTYQKTTGKDSLKLQFLCSAEGKYIQAFRNPEKIIDYDRLNLRLSDLSIDRPGVSAMLPDLELNLNQGDLVQQKDHRLNLTTGVDLAWKNANIQYKKDSALLSVPSVSGRFTETKFNFVSGRKLEPAYLASAAQAQGNSLFYRNRQIHVRLGAYSWNGKKQELSLQHFEVMPNKSREESFRTAKWQKDYMELKGKQLTFTGIHFPDKGRDSLLHIHRVEVQGLALGTWRDRRIPFEHGIEKPMPTKMINAISFPFAIDTVWLSKNEIHVHEYSIGTGLWSDIPIESLSGYVANLRNRDNRQAQLSVEASALFFRNPIQHFSYREAYGDSLSPFRASILLTKTNLRAFRELGMALAAVDIRSGHADTIDVDWSGNKYAATGDMHFMFERFRIKMYDKKDTARQSFMQLLKTKLANLVLPGSKDANTFLYFERDREKFVFNYWVKTQAKGFLAAVGLKSSKKYLKEYNEKAPGFGLEPIDPAALNGRRLTVNGKRYFSVNR
ncbi:MAG TPA: hypothetical protein VG890_11310, partial [Puia sp.]|nr:hypothetical protein [Puia sp.]